MGRPLFSTSLVSPTPAVRVAEPIFPVYQKWSHWNAFDPDSDEFFEGENVEYEAFLTPEQIEAQQRAREILGPVEVSSEARATVRADDRFRRTNSQARPDSLPLPDLSDDSSSDGSASGRGSPTTELSRTRRLIGAIRAELDRTTNDDHPPPGYVPSVVRVITSVPRRGAPTSPIEQVSPRELAPETDFIPQYTYMYQLEAQYAGLQRARERPRSVTWRSRIDTSSIDVDGALPATATGADEATAPTRVWTPMRVREQDVPPPASLPAVGADAVASYTQATMSAPSTPRSATSLQSPLSPMSPPPSVTPRSLVWADVSVASPSPSTPASRMALSHIAPPSLSTALNPALAPLRVSQ